MKLNQKHKDVIKIAIEKGNDKYWRDAAQQAKNHRKWKASGFTGECESVKTPGDGSIIAYIYEEIIKELEKV
jgi:hypothetical protein